MGEEKTDSSQTLLKPESVLEGPFWPERVRVISSRQIGASVEIRAVGLKPPERFYSRILTESDLTKIKRIELRRKDFSGDAEAFFLSMEGKRIRFAYQFDPLYAVNVSQIDPLPHQIDGVYYYILKHPRIRFLIADDPGAGKTIMAGLILKELKQRGLVDKTLIVIPGHLRDQWLREMKKEIGEVPIPIEPGIPVEEVRERKPVPEVGVIRRFKLVTKVPWNKLSDVMRGVLIPLDREGAQVTLEMKIEAQSEKGISKDTLDLKIKETLNQIGAKVLEEEEE